jgi:hypothetical protein
VNPGIPDAIAAAQAAAIAAADRADRAAAFHASCRRHVAGLLAASILPAAASLVFARDEDTVTAETEIKLISMRGAGGALLWYNDGTCFAGHPDAEPLGEPAQLDADVLSAIEYQLAAAYDAAGGGFDTADDGADVMPGANLLILAVPFPAPGLPRFTGDAPVQLDALDRFQADEPDDTTKQDPELICMTCGAALLDIEAGSTLGMLVQTAIEHECPRASAGRA